MSIVAVGDTLEKACSASSCRGKSVDQPLNPYLAGVPVVLVAPRVLVHPAGRAQSTRTAGISDHPDYSNPLTIINSPSRLRSFSTSDPAQIAQSSQPSFQKVVSYLNTKQSSAASNNPLLREKLVLLRVSHLDVSQLKPSIAPSKAIGSFISEVGCASWLPACVASTESGSFNVEHRGSVEGVRK